MMVWRERACQGLPYVVIYSQDAGSPFIDQVLCDRSGAGKCQLPDPAR